MARKQEAGIYYYPMNTDHVVNSKVKLLFAEFDSHGPWIWHCLLSEIYSKKGYYMDISDQDYLTLFASDVCKKPVSLVNNVISGCVRRGLFDKSLFDMFQVLTSDRIQENYVEATSERRRKGAKIEMREDLFLLNGEIPRNIRVIPRNNDEIPVNNLQKKVKESKVEESKEKAHSQAPVPEVEIVMPWQSQEFISEWNLWKKFKREQFRFSYKKIAEQAALKELAELSAGDEDVAIAIIHQSMSKGWQGLFELKLQTKKNGNHQETTTERPIVAAAREVLRRAAGQDTD